MNWKSWPYWIKGILVGVVAYICFGIILSLVITSGGCGVRDIPVGGLVGNDVCEGYLSRFFYTLTAFGEETFSQPLLLVLFSFVGLILGFFYRKFKNREK